MPRTRSSGADKFPQLLNVDIAQTVLNTDVEVEVHLPVPRYGAAASRPYCFEILKVWVTPGFALCQHAAVAVAAQISTIALGAPLFADPRVIFREVINDYVVATGKVFRYTQEYDYTTNDRGLLVGTDNLYFLFHSANLAALGTCHFQILYRLTTVSPTEFIGIVQSQS